MEHRPLYLAAWLILALSWSPAGFADDAPDPATGQDAAWESRLREAKAVQKEAKAKKAESQKRYLAEKQACFAKFRVNDCQEEARQRHLAVANEANRNENRGLALERQIKKEKLADKDARRIAEAPEREADLKEREAETATERAEMATKQEKKLADKAKKAEEGARHHAEDEVRQQKKQERHEKQLAEKLQKAKSREAEPAK